MSEEQSNEVAASKKSSLKNDILFFDSMVTPKIIQFVYWFFLFVVVVNALKTIFSDYGGVSMGSIFTGLVVIVAGALGARIFCEILIVMFKMNEALQDMRNK